MFGSNIKIHFAGSDNSIPHMIAMDLADVKYRLFTCYPFIKNYKSSDDDFRYKADDIFTPAIIQKKMRHVIMDSGLFTLMFGAGKGTPQTRKTLELWQDMTAEFVKQNNLICTCVEIDCQKILGPKDAWYFRERMRKKMPNNRHINVFHLEDGKSGLDRLIDFSDYIAFSVPELRIAFPAKYRDRLKWLTRYAKNKKPTIDIHLLGCTEKELLSDNKFCTSADSTTWLSANRYGHIYNNHVRNIKKETRALYYDEICRQLKKNNSPITKAKVDYITNATVSAVICKRTYEKLCGDQN